MKKLISFAFAIALCVTAMSALAESVPSKATGDLMHFTVTAENQQGDGSMSFRPVQVAETKTDQELLDVCKVELEKLAASESIEAYFGNVIDKTKLTDMTDDANTADGSGNTVTLKDLMAENELNVFEFCPLIAEGFQEESGMVTADMLFATPYEKDERVIIMIGIVTVNPDGTQTVEWHAFEGIGLDVEDVEAEYAGRVQVMIDPETVQAIQNGTALLAVVSG